MSDRHSHHPPPTQSFPVAAHCLPRLTYSESPSLSLSSYHPAVPHTQLFACVCRREHALSPRVYLHLVPVLGTLASVSLRCQLILRSAAALPLSSLPCSSCALPSSPSCFLIIPPISLPHASPPCPAPATSVIPHPWQVDTWVPTPSQFGKMRTFFIGGSPELKDLSFAGVPPQANKVGRREGEEGAM